MTTRGEINSNFYQIVNVDANGSPTSLTSAITGNITSVGTLASLTANGIINFTTASNVSLGSNSNVKITGGTSGYYLQTDGTGNLSWATGGGTPGGSNTQIQYNNAGAFGGTSFFTYATTPNGLGNLATVTLGSNSLSSATGNLVVQGSLGRPTTITGSAINTGGITYFNIIGSGNGVVQYNGLATQTGLTLTSTANITITPASGYATYLGDTTYLGYATFGNYYTGISLVINNPISSSSNASITYNPLVTQAGLTLTSTANITLTPASGSATYLGNLVIANYFSGSGNNLSNIQASNISGTIANANYATYAGIATSANSVAVANVVGIGNIATINLNGNGSQVLYGNGVFASAGTIANANYASYAGNVTVNAQPNITSVGTLSSLSVTGNISSGNANLGNAVVANFFIGSGNNLSNIQAANYASYAGNVTVNAQPNITSVGTLSSLSVTGNISSGNANLGNVVVANFFIGSGNNLSNIQAANISGTIANANYATYSGTAAVANSVAVANVVGIGNIATINLTGNGSQVLYGNGVFASAGTVANANYASYAGNVTVNAQPNITSVGTLTSLSVTGNISSGNANLGNLIIANYHQGVLITNAQPNITSTGTLVSLSVTGNVSTGNISGNIANITTGNIGNILFTRFNETVLSSTNTSTSISPDISTGTIFRYTANNNFTFNGFTNAVAGISAVVVITQDGTGSRVMTSTMKFAGGSKTLSTAANAIDTIGVFYDGSTYYASLVKAYA